MNTENFYIIDIGTNSARLMKARFFGERAESFYKLVTTVRTGEGMEGGMLAPEAIKRVTDALVEFKTVTDREDPSASTYVFATSAVRDALNRDELLKSVKAAAGFDIEVISGEEEALLSFAGAAGKSGGIIDLGGGSIEVARGEDGVITYKKSFDIGIVRAKNMFSHLSEREAAYAAYEYSAKLFCALPKELKGKKYTAVGGTATSAAAMLLSMDKYDPKRIQGLRVTRAELVKKTEELLGLSLEERKQVKGLPPKRADVIVNGIAILVAMMDALEITEYFASDSDNLEGYALIKLKQ